MGNPQDGRPRRMGPNKAADGAARGAADGATVLYVPLPSRVDKMHEPDVGRLARRHRASGWPAGAASGSATNANATIEGIGPDAIPECLTYRHRQGLRSREPP